MFHKIQAVTPLEGAKLLAIFCEGVSKSYDMNPMIEQHAAFRPLRDAPGLFRRVTVEAGGCGISWNDSISLSSNELWENGTVEATPFDGLIAFSEATALWGLSESTLRKAVAYGRLREGVDCLKYGKQWIVSRPAMLREYGPPKIYCT